MHSIRQQGLGDVDCEDGDAVPHILRQREAGPVRVKYARLAGSLGPELSRLLLGRDEGEEAAVGAVVTDRYCEVHARVGVLAKRHAAGVRAARAGLLPAKEALVCARVRVAIVVKGRTPVVGIA